MRNVRLIDCFLQLLAVTAFLDRTPERIQADFETVRNDIEGLLAEGAHQAALAGFSEEESDRARFAVCAWVDETIQVSGWPGREQWSKYPLQREYYGTANAGEEFFTRLDGLGEEDLPVREVFATCLALGFKGRFFLERQKAELDQVCRDNLKALWGETFDGVKLDQGRLFPQAYAEGRAGRRRWRRSNLFTLIGMAAPPVILVALFIIYRYLLNKNIFDFLY